MSDKKRILYDYQIFHIQRFGGISRYFAEIAKFMQGVEPVIDIELSMNQYLDDKRRNILHRIPKRIFKPMEGFFRMLNRRHSANTIRQMHFDVFHPTYYDPYFLDLIGSKPFVLTIHDMTHERFPQYFSPNDPTSENKRLLAEKAERIIAISESTKNDIVELLNIPERKIDVIYHGINPQPLAKGRIEGLPEQYILYVGERRGYKNFGTAVEAFARMAQQQPELHLVLTGRALSKAEKKLFEEKNISNRVMLMNDISDQLLAQLYRYASLFVYPSLYEGFGIPILEAFAQECPVVLSRASCFPEVAADAAEYFDPKSADELACAMQRVLTDNSRRGEMIARGRERLKMFTWEETARLTEETYNKVINGNK